MSSRATKTWTQPGKGGPLQTRARTMPALVVHVDAVALALTTVESLTPCSELVKAARKDTWRLLPWWKTMLKQKTAPIARNSAAYRRKGDEESG